MSDMPKFDPPPPPIQLPMKSSSSAIGKRPISWSEIRALGAAAATILAIAFAAYFRVIGDARAEVDAGVHAVQTRLDAVEGRQHSTDDEVRSVKAEVKETQADIRALYKAVMTGRRQERLEDAGSP